MSETEKKPSLSSDRLAAVEETVAKSESAVEMLTSAAKRLWGTNVIVLVTFTIVVAGVTLRAKDSMAQDNQKQIDAGVKPTADALQKHLIEDMEYKKSRAEFERRVENRFDEQGTDIRALYKAMMTGQKQERLERPLPVPADGGE